MRSALMTTSNTTRLTLAVTFDGTRLSVRSRYIGAPIPISASRSRT